MVKKVVVLTGAGISAESGLKTFRDHDGLWEGYNVYDVATPEAWKRNAKLVLDFYNLRRKAVLEAMPNQAHIDLAKLEAYFDVQIITQNVDNLHERAGSTKVLHLHGEITKSQSSVHSNLVYDIDGWELQWGECCEQGYQLRPFIVWFGEAVPMIEAAAHLVSQADYLMIVGTSLQVYPAAGLVTELPSNSPIILVDPGSPSISVNQHLILIKENAVTGVNKAINELMNLHKS
jgi:NAD-dependent deacetylase